MVVVSLFPALAWPISSNNSVTFILTLHLSNHITPSFAVLLYEWQKRVFGAIGCGVV